MTRNFTGDPLDAGLVESLLADALRAPTAGNTRAVELVWLSGPTETSRYWETTTDAAWRSRSRRYAGMARAPVVVLPFVDPEAYRTRYREPDKAPSDGTEQEWIVPFWHVDAAFSIMTLLLRAEEERLGAAFLGNFRGEAALKDALGVPAGCCWIGAVLLGHAALPDPRSSSLDRPARPVETRLHRGSW